MQRVENVADLDAQHLGLVAIDIEIDLRRVGGIGAEHAGKLGLLVGGNDQPAHDRGNVGRRLALQRFEHVLEAAGIAEAEDRRQVEREDDGALDRGQLRPQLRDDGVGALRRVGALFVRLQSNDEERLVGGRDIIDEVESDHRQHALHARNRPDDILDLFDHLLGAVDRGTFGQPHGGENGALILVGQKALRRLVEHEGGRRQRADCNDHAEDRHAGQAANDGDIAVARASMAPST